MHFQGTKKEFVIRKLKHFAQETRNFCLKNTTWCLCKLSRWKLEKSTSFLRQFIEFHSPNYFPTLSTFRLFWVCVVHFHLIHFQPVQYLHSLFSRCGNPTWSEHLQQIEYKFNRLCELLTWKRRCWPAKVFWSPMEFVRIDCSLFSVECKVINIISRYARCQLKQQANCNWYKLIHDPDSCLIAFDVHHRRIQTTQINFRIQLPIFQFVFLIVTQSKANPNKWVFRVETFVVSAGVDQPWKVVQRPATTRCRLWRKNVFYFSTKCVSASSERTFGCVHLSTTSTNVWRCHWPTSNKSAALITKYCQRMSARVVIFFHFYRRRE